MRSKYKITDIEDGPGEGMKVLRMAVEPSDETPHGNIVVCIHDPEPQFALGAVLNVDFSLAE